MKGQSAWNYKPYTKLDERSKATLPYICRVASDETTIIIEWFDKGAECEHVLRYKKRNDCQAEKEIILKKALQ